MTALSIPVQWPRGPVPWLICFSYIPMLMIAFWPGSRQLILLDQLWTLALAICKTEQGVKVLMAAAMGAHTIESLYTFKLCWDVGVSHEQLMGWCSLTLLLGYGAILPLKRHIAAAKQKAAVGKTS